MTTPPFRYNIALLGIDTLGVKRRFETDEEAVKMVNDTPT
jgi:hypothetical protein